MAVPIVDQLEIVGIDHHHRQVPVMAQRPAELFLKRREKTPVEEKNKSFASGLYAEGI
jgi:hypothetical protein